MKAHQIWYVSDPNENYQVKVIRNSKKIKNQLIKKSNKLWNRKFLDKIKMKGNSVSYRRKMMQVYVGWQTDVFKNRPFSQIGTRQALEVCGD